MQLMIDITIETPAALRLAAQFLIDHAALREALDAAPSASAPVPPPPPPLPNVPAGTSSVVPFPVPPVPPAPPRDPRDNPFRGMSDATPHVSAPALVPSAAPGPTTTPSSALPATTTSAGGTPDELDSAGVPWDGRIHQKGKGQKKDKTWKLQKGIDDATVAAVIQELQAQGRIRSASTAPSAPGEGVPAAPSFPGSVPVPAVAAPAAPGVHTQVANSGAPVPVPPPPTDGGVPAASVTFPGAAGAAVPVPPAPVLGVPNATQPGVVQVGFRELVAKISAARNTVPPRLTAEEVQQCVAAAGVANLQALSAMAHKVPEVDQYIDMLLATR